MWSCAGDRVDQGLEGLLEDVHFLKYFHSYEATLGHEGAK